MVYYFTSNVASPPAYIYVGKDKVESECAHENFHLARCQREPADEELIKYGLEEDIWYDLHLQVRPPLY